MKTNRRSFIKTGLAAAAGSSAALSLNANPSTPCQKMEAESCCNNPLPRWRGFNLMPFFSVFSGNEQYKDMMVKDLDLKWIRDWGFDYVRLPIDYWFFVDSDWKESGVMRLDQIRNVNESALEKLDQAIEQCVAYGLHITVNMHRVPGYCINGWDKEPFNLWKDAEAEAAFLYWWELLAKRYRGVSAKALSFNLVNEAPNVDEKMSRGDYRRVMLNAERLIHQISPDRTIIIDGTGVGREVVMNMIDEPVAQAFHAYDPHPLTHYKATWVGDNADWKLPTWPMQNEDGSITGEKALRIAVAPWVEVMKQGVGVHCGEFGCYRYTPHKVFLEWISVVLEILKEKNIGWSLWNFRGDFGILDSSRTDVAYEDWHGHQLDRKLLEILLKY